MRTTTLSGFLLVLAAAACGHRTAGPVTEPHMAPEAGEAVPEAAAEAAPDVARGVAPGAGMGEGRGRRMGPRAAQLPRSVTHPDDGVLAQGRAVFDRVCAQCHTVAPPPKLAPPMAMVASHLRDAFPTEDEAVAHILAYVPAPHPDRSILPAHAVERFGLMAPQDLPREDLERVARYVWSLGEAMAR